MKTKKKYQWPLGYEAPGVYNIDTAFQQALGITICAAGDKAEGGSGSCGPGNKADGGGEPGACAAGVKAKGGGMGMMMGALIISIHCIFTGGRMPIMPLII